MGELIFFLGLQVKQKEDRIFISQDKYVTEILKKFGFTDVKTASTPMETQKPLLKDADGENVDEHLYRSIIGSLMYLTSSTPDIMFVKQTVVANSITEVEYIAASNCYRQTKTLRLGIILSEILMKKKLIQMIKIHTDQNVADLLTKAFDVRCLEWNEKAAKDEIGTVKRKTFNGELQFDKFPSGDTEEGEKRSSTGDANGEVLLQQTSTEEITLAQTLAELRSEKPKIVVQEPVQSTTTTAPSAIPKAKGIIFNKQEQAPIPIVSSQQQTQVKDKGKGKMVEEEPVKKMSKKELLKLDEELAFKLQAEEEEQARLAREKDEKVKEANIS
ncbi:hypothetical protein Tco_0800758 [Tanacetum coccineum]|uniref:Reverse transcriptase Ty1/copia-type domain-containing protein n=1 Tax=Tanacetum coccineum TaxID=301880 RepID=A0ABQ4ZXU6_9ASTR